MSNVYGFLSYPSLVNNTIGGTNPLGELTTEALSYAKEKGLFSNQAWPHTQLTTFHNGLTLPNLTSQQLVGSDHVNICLEIGEWLYTRATSGATTNSSGQSTLLEAFSQAFSTKIADPLVGPMVTDNTVWLPAWVQFTLFLDLEITIKLWLSNSSFLATYPGWEYEFIPPFNNPDVLFNDPTVVASMLNAITYNDYVSRANSAKKDYPYTEMSTLSYDLRDPQDSTFSKEVTFIALIYGGAAGRDIDNLKAALITWILEHSDHTRAEWQAILPGLFAENEFVIVPFWDRYAVEPNAIVAGIYSPTISVNTIVAIANRFIRGPGISQEHIAEYLTISGSMYKSLSFCAVGSPINAEGKFRFQDFLSDYMVIPTTSVDFNRMRSVTQGFITAITNLFIAAEVTSEGEGLPAGITRIERDNVKYVTMTYDSARYLVVRKDYYLIEV